MAVDSNAIGNQALQLIGANAAPVQGEAPNFDNSPGGVALQKLYAPCVATIARRFGWDFGRNTVTLALSGNPAPFPYAYEYLYPGNGVQIWQISPGVLDDKNNPLPTQWATGNALVSSVQTKVIWTNVVSAQAVYNNNPSEATWDSIFREAVVRLLASELSMALPGRPDSSEAFLESGSAFETIGESRDS